MRFGIFYEHQLPRPWDDGAEHRLLHDALEQVELADRLGFDCVWEVEHPAQIRELVRAYEAAGVDQLIFVSQSGRTRHEDVCESPSDTAVPSSPQF